ncbi:MAG: alpha/beta fold hydrolase [Candidatus Lernaella stagnicola]|nr:alpha/beta fold hydrolase [Candidatus Lernaella stagnicola]
MKRHDIEAKKQYARDAAKRFAAHVPGLREAVGEPARVDDFISAIREEFVTWRGLRLHLDIYESAPTDPVLIFHGGIGTYVRFYVAMLALLSRRGFNIIAVDRPGHGFSEGKVGDCTVEDVRDFLPLVIEKAGEWFNDRIGMFGSSLGGITTFYLLPDVRGIRSALCHNWLLPGELPAPNKGLLRSVARLGARLVPRASVPMSLLLDEEMIAALSVTPFVEEYFRAYRDDPVLCSTLTLRSVVSFFGGYRPWCSFREVEIPVLGLIGENDGMLPLDAGRRWWTAANLPHGELHVIPGAHHLLFHDHLAESLPVVADWFDRTLRQGKV